MTSLAKAIALGAVLSGAALPAAAQTVTPPTAPAQTTPAQAAPVTTATAPRKPAAPVPTPASVLAGVTGNLASLIGKTAYVHEQENNSPAAVVIPMSGGTYEVDADCSGWVSHNLKKLPIQYEAVHAYQSQVPGEAEKPYPRANVYRQYFANLKPGAPFIPVKKLADVRPGDILSWCLPGHCGIPYTGEPKKDTGHVMVVMSQPIPAGPNRAFLMVLDSSSVPHYSAATLPASVQKANPGLVQAYARYPDKRDTVSDGKAVSTSGVGAGFILFGTDANGAVNSFQFGPGDSVNSEGILFAVGRPVAPSSTVASK